MKAYTSSRIEQQSVTRHHTVWINGRFLSRKVTGVERVGHEILRALNNTLLDE